MHVSHVAHFVSLGSHARATSHVDVHTCRSDMPSWFRPAPTDGASNSHVRRATRFQHHVTRIDANALRRTWIVLRHDARAQRLVSMTAPVVRERARRNVLWTSMVTGCFSSPRFFFYHLPPPTSNREGASHDEWMDNCMNGKRRESYSAVLPRQCGAWSCFTKEELGCSHRSANKRRREQLSLPRMR